MKKISFKKRALVLTLVAALGLAVYLNYYFADHLPQQSGNLGEAVFVGEDSGGGETEETVSVGAQTNYFDQARKNRETAREEAVDIIKDIAADLKSDATAAGQVVEKTEQLTAAITAETKAEELIKAKGFADCVVFISEEGCSIVVKSDNLTGAESLQITEIATAQTGVPAQKINIMAINS